LRVIYDETPRTDMNNSSNRSTPAAAGMASSAVELNDSYDVEESVTSSAVFLDSPNNKQRAATMQPSEASPIVASAPSPMLLGPSAVETSAEEGGSMLDTSLMVDDAMLGVTAAPAPAPTTPPRGGERNAASPSNDKQYNGDYLSKVPTTITLPHSIESSSSSGTMPPLASPLDGEDDEEANGDPKNRLLVSTSGLNNTTTSSSSGGPEHARALQKRRRCLLLTAVAALLVLAAVAGTLAYLLGKSGSQGGAGGSSSSSNATNTTGDNVSENPPTTGQDDGGSDPNSNAGGQGGGGDAAAPTSAPVAAPAPTPSPIASTELYRVALQVTPSEALDDPTTPQGMAIRWLLQPSSSASATSTYTPPSETKMLQRYAVTVLEMALNPNGGGSSTAASSRAATNSSSSSSSFNVGPLPGYESKDECEWFGIICAAANSTDVRNSSSTNTSSSSSSQQDDLAGMVTTLNWANRNMEGKIPAEIGLLSSLSTLDLGTNRLRGWIPSSIYNLTSLQYLYLHQNQLSGPISNRIANLTHLVRFYAGNNQLTGTLPTGLASPGRGAQSARPLRTCAQNRAAPHRDCIVDRQSI
jgi:Leucine rich repeat